MAALTDAFTTEDLTPVLLIGSLVLIVSVAAVRLSVRSGFPSLLLYLFIGVLLGEGGLGIKFDSGELTQVLGYSALVLILAEGGLTTSWPGIRSAVGPAVVLSTVGVVVSVVVVAVAAHWVLGISWELSMLLGAILSSTDAAAVFSVLRRVPLPPQISGMLEAESGFNDAPVVILVVALAQNATHVGHVEPWWELLFHAVTELTGGAAIGLLVGWLGGRLMKTLAGGSSGLFSIGVVAITVLAYAAAREAHTSGFIAVYLAGLVIGNSQLPHRAAVHGFTTALGWLAQIGLFVMLGLLASPSGFASQFLPALLIGSVLLLLARPLSVLVSLTPFRYPLRTQAFLSWAGLRGAVPVVLATVPMTIGTPSFEWIFNLVFVLVVVFTFVQAPTLPWVAKRLGVDEPHLATGLQVDATPLEELGADIIQVEIGPASKLGGVRIFELRLPPGANVTLIVRDEKGFVPKADTALRHGDQLLIVTTDAVREHTEQRIRAVSEHGRLAGWRD
ncbi:Cell volume regulation protein CvrA [Nostocoides japonicum T1-X7]|uniref:Cell volume regulation protein CvrA n=1 Tax=Nostocoides japonicum T1-X7 TaxID=1194083 RepID=A0A077LV14_9MICO|nr:potassium/proton antiporter [Tetrasphaera japonica]CCH76587.1 Cell volume regulation protein CvrA [Tetrasphaera japonica T1-X7]